MGWGRPPTWKACRPPAPSAPSSPSSSGSCRRVQAGGSSGRRGRASAAAPGSRPGGSSLLGCRRRTVVEKQRIQRHPGRRPQTQSRRKAETPCSRVYPALTQDPRALDQPQVPRITAREEKQSGRQRGQHGDTAPPAGGAAPRQGPPVQGPERLPPGKGRGLPRSGNPWNHLQGGNSE